MLTIWGAFFSLWISTNKYISYLDVEQTRTTTFYGRDGFLAIIITETFLNKYEVLRFGNIS